MVLGDECVYDASMEWSRVLVAEALVTKTKALGAESRYSLLEVGNPRPRAPMPSPGRRLGISVGC